MHIEERKLDVAKQDGRAGQIKPVVLRRGESGQTQIKITLTDNGAPFSVASLTPRFCAVLPDLKFVRDPVNVSAESNVVTYTVQSDLTSAAGNVRVAYIELLSSGISITSDTLPIVVLENVELSDEDAKKYQNDIDELLKKLQEQKDTVDLQEAARVQAEKQRAAQEQTRQNQESTRQGAESERAKTFTESQKSRDQQFTSAQSEREQEFNAAQSEREQAFDDAESERDATVDAAAKKANDAAAKANTSSANADAAEAKRADAEAKRVTAEQGRVTAESGRVTAESGRVTAESSRVTAERERESSQDANDLAQAKNNADQAQNNQMAKGFLFETATAGADGKPNVTSPKMGVLYMIPKSEGKDPDQHQEWLWTGSTWELWGDTNATVTPITTAEVDSAFGGTALTTDHVLVARQLTYVFSVIKNWVANTAKAASAKLADVATKLGSATVGSSTEPIYLNQGTPTKITKVAAASTADSATSATTATKLGSATVGSATEPIYLNLGAPTKISKVAAATKADSATAADSAATLSVTLGVAKGGTGATTLTSNQVLLGNGTSAIKSTAASGTGVLQRSAAANAPAFGSVPTGMIADGAVTLAKLANNSVNAAKIVDGSVGTNELASNAVTSAKIADGTIVAADLSSELLKKITDSDSATSGIIKTTMVRHLAEDSNVFWITASDLGVSNLMTRNYTFMVTNGDSNSVNGAWPLATSIGDSGKRLEVLWNMTIPADSWVRINIVGIPTIVG